MPLLLPCELTDYSIHIVLHVAQVGIPGGATLGEGAGKNADDPDFTEEKARKQFEEIKKAIASGNAQLVETEREGVYIFKELLSSQITV